MQVFSRVSRSLGAESTRSLSSTIDSIGTGGTVQLIQGMEHEFIITSQNTNIAFLFRSHGCLGPRRGNFATNHGPTFGRRRSGRMIVIDGSATGISAGQAIEIAGIGRITLLFGNGVRLGVEGECHSTCRGHHRVKERTACVGNHWMVWR